jgi:hypothetical protein
MKTRHLDDVIQAAAGGFADAFDAREGFVRWCFASTEDRLADGVKRLAEALGR